MSFVTSRLLTIATLCFAALFAGCADDSGSTPDAGSDVIDAGDILDTDGETDVPPDASEYEKMRAAISPLPANTHFARPAYEDGTCPEEDYSAEPPEDAGTPNFPEPGEPFEQLSEYNFFWGDMRDLNPVDGVIPYTSVSFLWADGTGKARFIVIPDGEKVTFSEGELWDFPEGTIIVKNFMMPEDARDPNCGFKPLETRLLIREDGDWVPEAYVWNEDYTDAERDVTGESLTVSLINKDGNQENRLYKVPKRSECSRCHGRVEEGSGLKFNHMLGLVTSQVNADVYRDGEFVNQIEWLDDQGIFENEVPDTSTLNKLANPMDDDAGVVSRARSYLHANCAHCHRDQADAERSQLYLHYEVEDFRDIGICKSPLAAGAGAGDNTVDIFPGAPEDSIMPYRMNALDPGARMPELATLKVDEFGVNLISDWIEQMPELGGYPTTCDIEE
jgi:uncharacterized repeat protein (TIGR03806 family)